MQIPSSTAESQGLLVANASPTAASSLIEGFDGLVMLPLVCFFQRVCNRCRLGLAFRALDDGLAVYGAWRYFSYTIQER
jgi:hypothetical protein